MEVSTRKPYFINEEEEEEASSSLCHKTRNNHYHLQSYYYYNHQYSPRSVVMSAKFNDFRFERQPLPHFLDSCFLCKKRLGENRDIFMYRGDTPFCSEECRGEQIERDEVKEKKENLSSSVKAMRRNEKRSSSSSPTRTRPSYNNVFHNGTLAAA